MGSCIGEKKQASNCILASTDRSQAKMEKHGNTHAVLLLVENLAFEENMRHITVRIRVYNVCSLHCAALAIIVYTIPACLTLFWEWCESKRLICLCKHEY